MTEYSGDFVSLSLALNCVGDGLFWRLSANSLWRLAAKLAGQVTQASKDINEGSEPQTRQTGTHHRSLSPLTSTSAQR